MLQVLFAVAVFMVVTVVYPLVVWVVQNTDYVVRAYRAYRALHAVRAHVRHYR